ncbi:MAG: gliding motility-associated C-terminal domain-containing protein, partial [Chitinophagales bacterium]|nr:gliding motility-associated C-terminal domain-containing protein [Chitinophagales bacterium]
GGTNYQWSDGAGNTASIIVNPATTTIYTVTVSDAAACSATDDVTVIVNNSADAGADNSTTVCDNSGEGTSTIDLSTLVSAAGGVFAPIGGAPALAGTTFDGEGLPTGNYEYNYTVAGIAPCPDDVATISITVNDCAALLCPTITTALDSLLLLCVDKEPDFPALEDAVVFSGNSATFSGFAWYSDAAMTTLAVPTDYAYSGDGCAEQNVTLYLAILCSLDPTPIAAGSLQLVLYPPFDTTYLNSVQSECTVPILTSTCSNYTIAPDNVPTEVNPGDSGIALWTVSYNGVAGIDPCFSEPYEIAYSCPAIVCPEASFTALPITMCAGDVATLTFTGTALPTDTYTWTIAGQTLTGAGPHSVEINSSGNFEAILIVQNAACADTAVQFISVSDLSLTLTASPTTITSGGTVLLSANAQSVLGNDISYTWLGDASLSCTDCATPSATPITDATYSVTVSDEFGCMASAAIGVTVAQPNIAVLPSAFSPNGDGIDDLFRPLGENIATSELFIYNRWGNILFSTTTLGEGWDGTHEGKPVEIGVYVYYLNVIFSDGKTEFYKGNVTLIR